ncbi:hypothetical protein RHSIM_Rhsim08G0150600 [Rhododendron simsii]|uniref:Uncharacterized protein n=1 Tax=Rhododendron simsii TaxID=118357 RepID=A0A834GM01_RHOSS|nr:hypothetical protein RHSIM_Rhsim08G0150600 [Rhododendron simsii]
MVKQLVYLVFAATVVSWFLLLLSKSKPLVSLHSTDAIGVASVIEFWFLLLFEHVVLPNYTAFGIVHFVFLDDLRWLAKIMVALEFACLLECLHDQQLLRCNIGPTHLMVDQVSLHDFFFSFCLLSVKRLFDFAMLVGGGFGEISSREYAIGSHAYVDPLIGLTGLHRNVVCILFISN